MVVRVTTHLATPQATRNFLDERKALFRAFDHDLKQGVGVNEIARMAADAFSRPVVLAYLNAKKLAADAQGILRAARLDGTFGAEVTGEVGRGAREVRITLVVDPQEIEQDQDILVTHLTEALLAEGIQLDTPEENSTAETLWDGGTVQLRRS